MVMVFCGLCGIALLTDWELSLLANEEIISISSLSFRIRVHNNNNNGATR